MKTVIDFTSDSTRLSAVSGCPSGLIRLLGRELVLYSASRAEKLGPEEIVLYSETSLRQIGRFADENGMRLACQADELDASGDLLVLCSEYSFSSELEELAGSGIPAVLVCREPVGTPLDTRIWGTDKEKCFAGAVYLPAEYSSLYKGGVQELLKALSSEGISIKAVETHFSVRLTDTAALSELQRVFLDNAGALPLPEVRERVWSTGSLPPAGVTVIPPVYIGSGVTAAPGSVIGPYTSVDDGTAIGRRARLEGSYIGRNVSVGAHCELSGAAVFGKAVIGAASRLGEQSAAGFESVIGEGSVLCSGVSVFRGIRTSEGAYICEDAVHSRSSRPVFDDEGTCSLGELCTPAEFIRLGAAVGSAVEKGSPVITAHTGSAASGELCCCLRIGLASAGCKVIELGASSKQLLGYSLSRCGAFLGCYVSSSGEDSLTLMSPGGLPVPEQLAHRAELAFSENGCRRTVLSSYSSAAPLDGMRILYEHWLRSLLPERTGLNISIRCPGRLIRQTADRVFEGFDEADGERIVFHISHDGSSCTASSTSSGYVPHGRLLLIAARSMFRKGAAVSFPFETSLSAERLAEDENGTLLRYFSVSDGIEDREARECAARPDSFFVRDGLALAAVVTSAADRSGLSFGEFVGEIPQIYCSQRFIGLPGSKVPTAFELDAKAVGQNAELFTDSGRAVVRRVRGSRGLMIFAESFSSEAALSLCDEVTERIKKLVR
ncbi:MAG: hypothetical protein IKO27_04355 [Ruminococcus sp.]|nr:hypothetical protein [Ruminococcus sp.]